MEVIVIKREKLNESSNINLWALFWTRDNHYPSRELVRPTNQQSKTKQNGAVQYISMFNNNTVSFGPGCREMQMSKAPFPFITIVSIDPLSLKWKSRFNTHGLSLWALTPVPCVACY